MTLRRLTRLLAAYVAFLVAGCIAVYARFRLRAADGPAIESVWRDGQLVRRSAQPGGVGALADGERKIIERVTGDAPIVTASEIVMALSVVPGRDGLMARQGDRVEYLTPDDLLSKRIYDRGKKIGTFDFPLGLDMAAVKKLLATKFGGSPYDVLDRVEIRRIRTERSPADPLHALRADKLEPEVVKSAIYAAAQHLSSGVTAEGRFRYSLDAATGEPIEGYNWARHGGSTYFLAQASQMWPDPTFREAARRASDLLIKDIVDCGEYRCFSGEKAPRDKVIDIGPSAIMLFTLVEVVNSGVDPSLMPVVKDLAKFIRSQQRPDGEFMHRYNRRKKKPIDRQGPYTTGEASLGLARAYTLTKDPADLKAASAALSFLVGKSWRFFGNRYYFGEEHWTCQAMAELWENAPNREALDFCLRWAVFNRAMQLRDGDTAFDSEGAHTFGPVLTPRFPPVASRSEAAIATLDAARRAGVDPKELAALETQVRRALGLLVRQQFRPGPTHLFAKPSETYGAVPGSQVDWELRIDHTRHASGAMLRWLEVVAKK
jgi:hypothetical protein